jgi:broad-specificity NMP kinase
MAHHDIIIIRGAPGAGKSETAKCLSRFFPNGVRTEVDTIRQMAISVDWTNQEEHISMLRASARLVIEFLRLGFNPAIVVDTLSGDKFNQFLRDIHDFDSNAKVQMFGLFTSDLELARRLELRPDWKFKDYPICKKLNDDVLKIKHPSEIQIDTTGRTPIETAGIIYNHLL